MLLIAAVLLILLLTVVIWLIIRSLVIAALTCKEHAACDDLYSITVTAVLCLIGSALQLSFHHDQ